VFTYQQLENIHTHCVLIDNLLIIIHIIDYCALIMISNKQGLKHVYANKNDRLR